MGTKENVRSIFDVEDNEIPTLDEQPKKRKYTRRNTKQSTELRTEPFSPKMIEDFTVQTFHTIASLKKAEYWEIQDREKEVRTWAGHAAHLANHLPMTQMAGASLIASALIVATGMGSLVIPRVATDQFLNSPQAQAIAQQQELKRQQAEREAMQQTPQPEPETVQGKVSPGTLQIVRDGMNA